MKPKYNRFTKPLPLFITLALSTLSYGTIFQDDTAGNAQPTAADNGNTTIRANGGTSATPKIVIDASVLLRGDAGEGSVVDISAPNYTLTNNGELIATNKMGIVSTNPFILNNEGRIEGNGAGSRGVLTPWATVTNSGLIFGDDDAIHFTSDGGSVVNSGIISALVGINSDAISAGNNVQIANVGSGYLTGQSGIVAGDFLNFTNSLDASVSGTTLSAIVAANGANINNFGNIQANFSGSAIEVGNGAVITNKTTFDLFYPFNPVNGGDILGTTSGITAGNNLTFTNQNMSYLEASGLGNGLTTGNDAKINNDLGGIIRAGQFGIFAGNDATIRNDGMIKGNLQDGVRSGDKLILINSGTIWSTDQDGVEAGLGADITNSGSITGAFGMFLYGGDSVIKNTGTIEGLTDTGIIIGVAAGDVIVTNTGLIKSAVNAFYGSLGNDVLNLNQNSRIVGDIHGVTGVNSINFNGGLSTTAAADGATSNSVLGNIYDMDTITKSGTGVAFIGVPGNTGYITKADKVSITGGGIYINGDLRGNIGSHSDIIAGGVAIGGTGEWWTDLTVNSGGFSAGATPINLNSDPTKSIGKVTVFGNVLHDNDSFIRYDVQPRAFTQAGLLGTGVTSLGLGNVLVSGGTTADLIDHIGTGSYDMGGGYVRVSATNNDQVLSDGTYVIVESDQVNYFNAVQETPNIQFNSTVTDTGFIGNQAAIGNANNSNTVLGNYFSTIKIVPFQIVLEVKHDFAGLPGLNANESAMGEALDNSINSANDYTQNFISALDYSDLETVQATLASLDPSSILNATTGIVSSNYRLNRLAQNHLAATRSGEMVQPGPVTHDDKGAIVQSQPAVSSGKNSGNVWGTFSYDWKDANGGNGGDIEGDEASFTAGVDYRIAPNLLLGIMIDGSRSDLDYRGGGSEVDSYRIAAYGTYGQSTGLYADFLLGYGDHSLDLDRNQGGILGGVSHTSTDAKSIQGMLTVGYAMQSGVVKHGPFAGFEYQNVEVDGFNQGGLFPIGVSGYDVDSLRGLIGYRAEARYGRFTPYASIAYAHEFEDGAYKTNASFGGPSFRVKGGVQESALLISIGTGMDLMDSLSLNVGYRGEISTGDGLDSHGLSAGLNYSF